MKLFFFVAVIFLLIIITFRQLPQTFYQQDEWLGSGQIMVIGYHVVTDNLSPIQLIFGEGRPLTRLLGAYFFSTFGFNTAPLAIYSVIFHMLNSLLIFLIALKMLKKYFGAFVVSSFFALNSIDHQSVTWYGASFGIQPATFFILLSIYLYLMYVEHEKKLYVVLSFLSAFLSLYFKEIGIFLFIFLPLTSIIFKKNTSVIRSIKKIYLFLIAIPIFGFFRVLELVYTNTSYTNASVYLKPSGNILLTLILRAIYYPLTSFSLIYIPYSVATNMSLAVMYAYYPYIPQYISRWDLIEQTVILDFIAMSFTILLAILLAFIYKTRKEFRKFIIFSLLFFFLSIMPYIVIEKQYAYMEPRYYYLTSLASGILLAIILDFFTTFFKNNKFVFLFIVILFLGYLRYQVSIIRGDIAVQVSISQERKNFLIALNKYLPTLKSNTNVFYFTGNKAFLVEGNKTPFQHGFGYSVMVIYYKTGKIPSSPLLSAYLFGLGEQGFKNIGGLQYGYYNDFKSLKASVVEHSINVHDVHAFYYNRDTKELSDITVQTQKDLEKEN